MIPQIPEKPLISIITVALNHKDLLEKTIQSVINQTYKNIEYIVIDGASTDGTLGIIKKYEDSIDYWVSEHDKGIYEAMNKGITLAQGEFINFMNAGDLFYEKNTLEKIFQSCPKDVDLIYGDYEIAYSDRLSHTKKAGNIKKLWKGMVFSHQSLFTRSLLLKSRRFDMNLGTVADFDFIFAMYQKGCKFYYTDFTISNVLAGGISEKYWFEVASGWRKVVKRYESSFKLDLHYSLLISVLFFISMIKNVLPKSVINSIRGFNGKAHEKSGYIG